MCCLFREISFNPPLIQISQEDEVNNFVCFSIFHIYRNSIWSNRAQFQRYNVGIGIATITSGRKLSISYGTGLGGDTLRAIYAEYTGSAHEGSAIEGRATSSTSNGIGGEFLVGYIGVRGRANEAQGSGPRRGVHGEASRGQYNLGVYGKANSTTSNTLTDVTHRCVRVAPERLQIIDLLA